MKLKLLFVALITGFTIHAQGYKPCVTDSMMKIALHNEPSLLHNIEMFRVYVDSVVANSESKKEAELRRIPLVIHIMHTGGSNNISDEQIHDAIRIINEDFRKLNADTLDVIQDFQPIYADIGVEFKLAKLDPDGKCTKGITRTYTQLTNDAGENVKELVGWNPRMYLNIWVVSNIASGAGGYSYLPGSAPNNDGNAGIVIRASQFGSIGLSSSGNVSSRSMTHEIGHYLGLPHTWGGSNDNNLDENCDIDDGIEDTPNTKGSSQICNVYQNSCGSLDNVQNFMDYSSCGKMYTEGQKTRMRSALDFGQPWHLAARNNLYTDENLMLTGTHPDYESVDCIANIDFKSSSAFTCDGQMTDWQNLSSNYDSAISYLWTFEGGTPSSSSEENPSVSYENPGIYPVTLSITTAGGENSKTTENAIYVQDQSSAIIAPANKNFYSNPFSNSMDNSEDWYNSDNLEGSSWEWNTLSSNSNGGSIRIKSDDFVDPGPRKAYSATYDLSDVSAPCYMYYDYAYARKDAESSDRFQVQITDDCGQNWSTRVNKSTDNLTTIDANIFFTFNPTINMWKEQRVSLNPFVGSSDVQASFIMEGSGGNFLYIDHIRFGVPNLSTEEFIIKNLHFRVSPNPNNGNARIEFNLLKNEKIELVLVDILGNKIFHSDLNYRAGQYQVDLNTLKPDLNSGMYYINYKIGSHQGTKQIVVL